MILRALFLRPVRRRPLRYLTTVAGVAVGVASVIATLCANHAAVASIREGAEEIAGRAQLQITRVGGLDRNILSRLRPLSGDAEIVPVVEGFALAPDLGDSVRVLGLDVLVDRDVRELAYTFAGGEGEDATDAGSTFQEFLRGKGVLLPEALAARLHLQTGDELRLILHTQPMQFRVLGVFKPPRFSFAWDRTAIVDIALAQQLFRRAGALDRVELLPRPGVSVEQLKEEIRALLPIGYQLERPSERRLETERMVGALEFNLNALSGVSLLVGIVLVTTTLSTAVVQRRSTIALLRSLGASSTQLAGALAVEAASIGLLGGALGVLGGLFGARMALPKVRETVAAMVQGVPTSVIRLEPSLAVTGIGLGILVSLCAAILPVLEALRTPPLQGLRGERPRRLSRRSWVRCLGLAAGCYALAAVLANLPAWEDRPVWALGSALAMIAALLALSGPVVDACTGLGSHRHLRSTFAPIRLALAALSAGRRRASWAAGAIGVAAALAVAIATMVTSFRVTVSDWATQTIRSDIWVRPVATVTGVPMGRLDPEIVRIAEEMFGAGAVDPFYRAKALLDGRTVSVGGSRFENVAVHGAIPFRDGRSNRAVFKQALRENGAVINESLANRYRLQEGGTIRLQVPGGVIERRVSGVYFDYGNNQGIAVLDDRDFFQHYRDEGPVGLALYLPEAIVPHKAREELLQALGNRWFVDALLNRQVRGEILAVFDRTFAITSALQRVSAVVAIIAVLTVLYALVDERRQDLALIQAIGGGRSQMIGIVIGEAGVLGVVGTVLGLSTGLAIGWVLVKVVNLQSFGWTLRFLPPYGSLLAMTAWIVPACLLAGLLPGAAAARQTVHEGMSRDA